MHAYASPNSTFARDLEEMMDNAAAEFRQAVHYVDTKVVPQVRRESSIALRLVAGHLVRLADALHVPENSNL